jgi:hypothetical protein
MARHATPSTPNIRNYTHVVTDIERSRTDRSAIPGAIDRICAAPWQSAAEREQAQALVARLARLLHSPNGLPQNGKAAPVEGADGCWPAN